MEAKTKKGHLTGKVLSGRFKLEALLEGGRSGEIYEAADLSGDGKATVVVFSGSPPNEPERLEALSRGIQDLFGLAHLNLGAVISQHLTTESHRKGEPPYLAYAEQDGIPLDQHIQEEGRLKPEMAAFIMLQVAGALEALHEKGICHGGLSANRVRVRPEHLLHDDHVRVHLPMVSGALLSSTVALLEDDEALTTEEAARLPYAAPEALLDETPTPSADIYAVGALLYLCLTGQPPLPRAATDSDPAATRDALLFDGPPPIAEVSPDLPRDLVLLVARCLAKDLKERPAAFEELRGVLSRFAPEPAVTGCGANLEPAPAEAAPSAPLLSVPTPVAFSLADAQREAALRRERPAPPLVQPPPAERPLGSFNTIAMPASPKMQEPVQEDSSNEPATEEQDLDPDDFATISMPSPFKGEPVTDASPPQKLPAPPSEESRPNLKPAGNQTEDFSTVLLSMDELEQDAEESPAAAPEEAPEPEPDLDPDDAMFHAVELSVEDLKRSKGDKGEE